MAHEPSCPAPLPPNEEDRSGSPLLIGLPEPAPKRNKAKEPVLSAGTYVPDSNLGSRLEDAVDARHRQILSEQTPPKEHTAKERVKGSCAGESAKGSNTSEESDKGSGAGKESAQGVLRCQLFLRIKRGR